ncbi:alpha/beta fold hydrolase [Frondihabitans cladoniiphilus]|uniref:Alpha/beta hydrolase n=1 Tax=Frondihabitans cladoniiphilus TaxID=715785 RepID=A0ABP8VKN2_9MICO
MQTDDVDEFSFSHEQAEGLGVAPLAARRETTEVDGREVSSLVWGSAHPTVAFLHGMGLNAHTWDSTVLSLGAPAVVLDLPGHGDSTWRDDVDYRPVTIAPAVDAAIRANSEGPLLLVGQSLGAMTALAVAALDPELATGLVLVDMSPGIRPADAAQVGDFLSGPQVFRSREEIVDRALEYGIGHDRVALTRGVGFNTRILDNGDVIWKHHFANLPDGIAPLTGDFPTLWPVLEKATVPILLVHGTTGYLSPEVVADFRERVPAARVVELEAGHNVQEHAPRELAATIASWAAAAGVDL